MSEILYMRISTHKLACSQRQWGGGGGGGRERERERVRERERESVTETVTYLNAVNPETHTVSIHTLTITNVD